MGLLHIGERSRKDEMNQSANRTDKIVVVDDDARIRDLLRRYLAQEGFEVIVAEDAKALSRIMLRDTIDLIVLDLMMPGEDGLSVCRRLRAAGDKTPIIMLTAKGEDVDRIVGLEVGADDYLGKPFNPRELLARIHAVLRRRPPQEAPGSACGCRTQAGGHLARLTGVGRNDTREARVAGHSIAELLELADLFAGHVSEDFLLLCRKA